MEMCVMVRKGKGVRHFQTEYPLTDGGGQIISIIRACPLLSLLAQHTCTCFFICMLDGSDDNLLLNLKTQQQQTSSAYGRLCLDPGCLYELVKVDEHTSMLAFQFLVSRSRPSCVSRN